ncbi:MAG: hypothetical protein ABSH17_10000 [Syntrophobacteraceae bacterium]|jgi:hypothetical protein
MRKRLCILLAVAICIISGCAQLGEYFPDSTTPPQSVQELRGTHYAKLNSIGCINSDDAETAMLANKRSDFETIDHLIREKRCFVIPTGTDVLIIKYAKGDIVSARLKDSRQEFYTGRSNLVSE